MNPSLPQDSDKTRGKGSATSGVADLSRATFPHGVRRALAIREPQQSSTGQPVRERPAEHLTRASRDPGLQGSEQVAGYWAVDNYRHGVQLPIGAWVPGCRLWGRKSEVQVRHSPHLTGTAVLPALVGVIVVPAVEWSG